MQLLKPYSVAMLLRRPGYAKKALLSYGIGPRLGMNVWSTATLMRLLLTR